MVLTATASYRIGLLTENWICFGAGAPAGCRRNRALQPGCLQYVWSTCLARLTCASPAGGAAILWAHPRHPASATMRPRWHKGAATASKSPAARKMPAASKLPTAGGEWARAGVASECARLRWQEAL